MSGRPGGGLDYFALKSPCKNCPFRKDIPGYLSKGRVDELEAALTDEGKTFSCHKTVNYDNVPEDDGEEEFTHAIEYGTEAQCAGALILLEKTQRTNENLMLQIAKRLGLYDPTKLNMKAPVYNTFTAMRKAMDR